MKKTLFLLTASALLSGCRPTGFRYTLTGHIEGLNDSVALVESVTKDTLAVLPAPDGSFRYKGRYDEPTAAALVRKNGQTAAVLYIEPGNIRIEGRLNAEESSNHDKIEYYPSGTPANDAAEAYTAASRALITEYRDAATTDQRREAIEEEFEQLTRTSVEANRDNFFGVMLMPNMAYELSGQEILDQIAKFSPEMQQTKELTELKATAEQKKRTDVGQPYINILQSDAEGQIVTLTSVIENPANKYTLVDFWASWCGPCMGEVPHLKETYDKFHKKGFEIYGVSFDNNRDKWLAAVKDNGMEWIHVSELQRFDNQAAKDYAVQGIPSNFLIDAQGKIVARNLRGEDLYKKVEELLGK